ncbi:DUF2218 domain-containing protein [Hwanghaeella sp.]|uniref:DUF2218 domain-containing protein n=1 Tax=Hwanghaeella sp. TaxID=2605943 RepID=UPI003CCBE0C4
MTNETSIKQPIESRAVIRTEKASRYLQQLCKHFGHKIPVTFDSQAGHISFPGGDCRLQADEAALTMLVSAPDNEGLENLEGVAARHLERFAFREDMQIAWQRV